MKVLFSPIIATSILSQSDLIKKLIQEKGYKVVYKNYIGINDADKPDVHALLWFTLGIAEFSTDVVATYLMSKKPKAVYVTVEGVPTPATYLCSNLPKLEFIAVSEFAKSCLEQAHLKVIDVVHHGIDLQEVQQALKFAEFEKSKFKERFGDSIVFLYVGRNDPRKNLKGLLQAVDILENKGIHDFVVLLHTDPSIIDSIKSPHVQFLSKFGSLNHVQVLKLMAMSDYLVFPSISEGFGLPVLEANSVGTPVLHAWFPPLSEFSSKVFNFTWDFDERELVQNMNRQYWIFHKYNPLSLAEMMEMAIDIFKNKKDEYEDYQKQAKQHAKKFDYRKIYPRLLRHINIS